MSWYEALLWIASLIGAVSVIVVAVRKALKPFPAAKDEIIDISKNA